MRGRRVVLLSLAVVAVGVMVALGALYLDPARAAVGPMPGVGMALPAQTRMVTGLDVRRFVASPFYHRYSRQGLGQMQARSWCNGSCVGAIRRCCGAPILRDVATGRAITLLRSCVGMYAISRRSKDSMCCRDCCVSSRNTPVS